MYKQRHSIRVALGVQTIHEICLYRTWEYDNLLAYLNPKGGQSKNKMSRRGMYTTQVNGSVAMEAKKLRTL
jgi:hypothetical protein